MKVTRKVASRRLKRTCIHCDTGFIKGNVYYLHREVFSEDGKVYAFEHLECAKCKYKRERWKKRLKRFKGKCNHPGDFVVDHWDYIPGEAVKQPVYGECMLCYEKI